MTAAVDEHRLNRKLMVRLVVFLFLLHIAAFLDRVNIGMAALTMNKDLGLSATTYGLANTVFYVGYIIAEIPSNLLLAKFGARRWLARIMITWGLASAATMFAQGPASLYGLRFLVGLAEGGFQPGVFLYLSYWFPPSYRARATAFFLLAQPLTFTLGGPAAGLLLRMDETMGLQGWQWLFLLEGLPSVCLGVVALFFLTDKPGQAKWLTEPEKASIAERIGRETANEAAALRHKAGSVLAQLGSRNVLLMALAYFGLVVSLNTNTVWTPQIMREALGGEADPLRVMLFTSIPSACALVVSPLWSIRSDRAAVRNWTVVQPMALALIGWLMVIFGDASVVRVFGLIFVNVGILTALPILWTLPGSLLSAAARPAGMGLISALGQFGSVTAPAVMGVFKDLTKDFDAGLYYVATCLAGSMLLVSILPKIRPRAAAAPPAPSAGMVEAVE
jgi:ACS family 4-hydroxyphenylacetate permease-like MFS transporter